MASRNDVKDTVILTTVGTVTVVGVLLVTRALGLGPTVAARVPRSKGRLMKVTSRRA